MAAGTILSHFSGAAVPFWWCSQVRVAKMVFMAVVNYQTQCRRRHRRQKRILKAVMQFTAAIRRQWLGWRTTASFSSCLCSVRACLLLSPSLSLMAMSRLIAMVPSSSPPSAQEVAALVGLPLKEVPTLRELVSGTGVRV